jgi:DNA repair protein RecO (recombination protein O)
MKQVSDQAVIINRIDYGEADKIITLITKGSGKITVLAKGVKKAKSKLAGSLELFSSLEISYIAGRSELKTLTSARLIRHYEKIAKDFKKSMFAYEVLKQVNSHTEQDCDVQYYKLLQNTFDSINKTESLALVKSWFYLSLLTISGYQPRLDSDKNGSNFDQAANYDYISDNSSFIPSKDGQLTANHIKLLRLLSQNKPEKLERVENVQKYAVDLVSILENASNRVAQH